MMSSLPMPIPTPHPEDKIWFDEVKVENMKRLWMAVERRVGAIGEERMRRFRPKVDEDEFLKKTYHFGEHVTTPPPFAISKMTEVENFAMEELQQEQKQKQEQQQQQQQQLLEYEQQIQRYPFLPRRFSSSSSMSSSSTSTTTTFMTPITPMSSSEDSGCGGELSSSENENEIIGGGGGGGGFGRGKGRGTLLSKKKPSTTLEDLQDYCMKFGPSVPHVSINYRPRKGKYRKEF